MTIIKRKHKSEINTGFSYSIKSQLTDVKNTFDLRPYLVLILGVYGVVLLTTSLFGIEYNKIAVVVIPLIYIFIAVLIQKLNKRGLFLLLITGFIWLTIGIVYLDQLKSGFSLLYNQGLSRIIEVKAVRLELINITTPDNSIVCTSFALIFALFPILLLLSYATLRKINVFISLILILPILEAGFYLGLKPSLPAITVTIAYLLATGLMQRLSSSSGKEKNHRDERNYIKSLKTAESIGLIVALIAGIIMTATGLLLPEQKYEVYINESPFLSQVNRLLDKEFWYELFSSETEIHGGICGGKIDKAGEFNFTGETDLVVTADRLRSGIYLKGFIGVYYTGSRWEPLSRSDIKRYKQTESEMKQLPWELPLKLLSINSSLLSPVMNAQIQNIRVENEGAPDEYTYVPYNVFYNNEVKSEADGSTASGAKFYTADYYDVVNYQNNLFINTLSHIKSGIYGNLGNGDGSIDKNKVDAYFNDEAFYEGYVNDTYLSVPDSLSERFKNDFGSLNFNNIEELIKKITGRLSKMAVYSLSPGTIPEGKDFIDYFLYENKQGYCTHFATTAVLAFRLNGIPARYAEGYTVTVDDYSEAKFADGRFKMEIKDTNSHAWVELYLNGFGWVPVEVTPGFTELLTQKDGAEGQSGEYQTGSKPGENEIPVIILIQLKKILPINQMILI